MSVKILINYFNFNLLSRLCNWQLYDKAGADAVLGFNVDSAFMVVDIIIIIKIGSHTLLDNLGFMINKAFLL